jgi:hypothetical protein
VGFSSFLPERTDEMKLPAAGRTKRTAHAGNGIFAQAEICEGASCLEVLRIIKAFVDAQWLSAFDEALAGYPAHAVEIQTA